MIVLAYIILGLAVVWAAYYLITDSTWRYATMMMLLTVAAVGVFLWALVTVAQHISGI